MRGLYEFKIFPWKIRISKARFIFFAPFFPLLSAKKRRKKFSEGKEEKFRF